MSQNQRPNSKSQVIILSMLHDGLTPTQAAVRFGVSRAWIYKLLARYKSGGLEAVSALSRRPQGNSRAIGDSIRHEIIRLRVDLLVHGLDAGAASIAWHLKQSDLYAPAPSTIWRILVAGGLVTPQPRKRPKAYITRFEAVQPNETWQSDFTHWRLADGRDVEIINWLDDHSRMLLSSRAFGAITGPIVITTFNQCRDQYGTPFSTLTDNGNVYTARFVGGKNGFEYLLSELEIVQKNGSPAHPQTQGKIERFHHTLKKWLSEQQGADDLLELQAQLDEFQKIYNTARPHKALGMQTPKRCYEATVKAKPKSAKGKEHFRVRTDVVDEFGKVTLRRAGKLHHLGVGRDHGFKRVALVVDHYNVMVVETKTGEILSKHAIEPSRDYWTNLLLDRNVKQTRKRRKK